MATRGREKHQQIMVLSCPWSKGFRGPFLFRFCFVGKEQRATEENEVLQTNCPWPGCHWQKESGLATPADSPSDHTSRSPSLSRSLSHTHTQVHTWVSVRGPCSELARALGGDALSEPQLSPHYDTKPTGLSCGTEELGHGKGAVAEISTRVAFSSSGRFQSYIPQGEMTLGFLAYWSCRVTH